jgi:hypothetical protein
MAATSELYALRDWVTSYLETAVDYDSSVPFEGVPVLSRKTGDLANQIETELSQTGSGILAVVMFPQGKVMPRQSARPVLDPVPFRVRLVEDTLFNKTGKTTGYLAERALAMLQWVTPDKTAVPGGYIIQPVDPGMLELILISKPGADPSKSDAENSTLAAWDVFFQTKLALQPAAAS